MSWSCPACTLENDADAVRCIACEELRPGGAAASSRTTSRKVGRQATRDVSYFGQSPSTSRDDQGFSGDATPHHGSGGQSRSSGGSLGSFVPSPQDGRQGAPAARQRPTGLSLGRPTGEGGDNGHATAPHFASHASDSSQHSRLADRRQQDASRLGSKASGSAAARTFDSRGNESRQGGQAARLTVPVGSYRGGESPRDEPHGGSRRGEASFSSAASNRNRIDPNVADRHGRDRLESSYGHDRRDSRDSYNRDEVPGNHRDDMHGNYLDDMQQKFDSRGSNNRFDSVATADGRLTRQDLGTTQNMGRSAASLGGRAGTIGGGSDGSRPDPRQRTRDDIGSTRPSNNGSAPHTTPAFDDGRGQGASEFRGCRLKLFVIGATNLMNTDLGILPGDVSDPFLVARLGKYIKKANGSKEFKAGRQEHKTEVIDNNLNPVWSKSEFDFQFDTGDEDVLMIEVFNSNQWHAHDSLGHVMVELGDNLRPGQKHNYHERLIDGDEGMVEFEVRFLSQQQVERGDIGGPPPGQHGLDNQNSALMQQHARQQMPGLEAFAQFNQSRAFANGGKPQESQYRAQNKVPLPSFSAMGKEAFEAPPPKAETAPLGERRKQMEYASRACHLGQYDYNEEPDYFPKQDMVDKRVWQADPFYGWRNNAALDDVRRQVLTEKNGGDDMEKMERWNKDPFHGWLQHEMDGSPVFGTDGKSLAALKERADKGLPDFDDIPMKRFDDHREYSNLHKHTTRERHEAPAEPDKQWKEDAFFGWLPGRGEVDAEHLLKKPFERARLMNCPSFSEQAINGLRGGRDSAGVVKVWINNATELIYDAKSRLQGAPSACVKMRVGSEERVTDTVAQSHNPSWHSSAFVFEVKIGDVLKLECWDLVGQREFGQQRDGHQFFLGHCAIAVSKMIRDYEETAMRHQENAPKNVVQELDGGGGNRHQATLNIDFLYVPYDSDAARQCEMVRATADSNEDERGMMGAARSTQRTTTDRHHTRNRGNTHANTQSHGLHSGNQPSHKQHGRHHGNAPDLDRSMGATSDRGLSRADKSNASAGSGMSSFINLGVLSVRVIAAYNLVNADSGYFGDYSDPYVTMKLSSQTEKQRKRTATIPNNLNPQWNSSPFLFPIKHENDELILEVYDDDGNKMISKSDDFIGRMKIPLTKFINNPNQSFHIKDTLYDIDQGELEVEIGFSPG